LATKKKCSMNLVGRNRLLWEVSKKLCKKKLHTETYYSRVLNNFIKFKGYKSDDFPVLKSLMSEGNVGKAVDRIITKVGLRDEVERVVDGILSGDKVMDIIEKFIADSQLAKNPKLESILMNYYNSAQYPSPWGNSDETTYVSNMPIITAPLGATFNCPSCGAHLIGRGDENPNSTKCPICGELMRLGSLE